MMKMTLVTIFLVASFVFSLVIVFSTFAVTGYCFCMVQVENRSNKTNFGVPFPGYHNARLDRHVFRHVQGQTESCG